MRASSIAWTGQRWKDAAAPLVEAWEAEMAGKGIDGKARYAKTAVEEVLPVTMLAADDRIEAPQGLVPHVSDATHPIVAGLPAHGIDVAILPPLPCSVGRHL